MTTVVSCLIYMMQITAERINNMATKNTIELSISLKDYYHWQQLKFISGSFLNGDYFEELPEDIIKNSTHSLSHLFDFSNKVLKNLDDIHVDCLSNSCKSTAKILELKLFCQDIIEEYEIESQELMNEADLVGDGWGECASAILKMITNVEKLDCNKKN